MKERLKQIINSTVTFAKNAWPRVKNFSTQAYSQCKILFCAIYKYSVIIFKNTWSGMMWIYNIIADMFRKVPAELTYWHDGVQNVVQVDDFVELAPNMIQYEDTDTKKRVKVKAEYPIKYILKEK
jgi:hypothetical protein